MPCYDNPHFPETRDSSGEARTWCCGWTNWVPEPLDWGIDTYYNLRRQCPLDYGRLRVSLSHKHPSFNNPRSSYYTLRIDGLGYFKVLPVELAHLVFDVLTLQDLTTLRRVSWKFRESINDYPTYKKVVRRAPDALRALLCTKTARYFTARCIMTLLVQPFCSCGASGGFLDVLSGQRKCHKCVCHSIRFESLRVPDVEKLFGITRTELNTARTMLSIPGSYGRDGYYSWDKLELVHERDVYELVIKQKAMSFTEFRKEVENMINPPLDDDCWSHCGGPRLVFYYRFMSVVVFPFLGETTQVFHQFGLGISREPIDDSVDDEHREVEDDVSLLSWELRKLNVDVPNTSKARKRRQVWQTSKIRNTGRASKTSKARSNTKLWKTRRRGNVNVWEMRDMRKSGKVSKTNKTRDEWKSFLDEKDQEGWDGED